MPASTIFTSLARGLGLGHETGSLLGATLSLVDADASQFAARSVAVGEAEPVGQDDGLLVFLEEAV